MECLLLHMNVNNDFLQLVLLFRLLFINILDSIFWFEWEILIILFF